MPWRDLFFGSIVMVNFQEFNFLILDKLIEWIDGEGLKTGLLVENRNIESPLSPKEEILFRYGRASGLRITSIGKRLN